MVRREKIIIDVDDLSLATLMLLKATNELFTLKHSFISEEAEFATQNDQHQTGWPPNAGTCFNSASALGCRKKKHGQERESIISLFHLFPSQ
jgi:hypothetical protein